MAIITTSALISDINGSVSGTTFQRTQGGLCMRSKTITRNPNSSFQQANKNRMVSIQNAWTNLTQAERSQWNQYAIYRGIKQKKNLSKNISGHQIFIRENSLRYSMTGYGAIFDNPIHSVPVLSNAPKPPIITVAVINFGNFEINYDTILISATQAILLWISAPIKESQKSNNIKRNMIKFISVDGQAQIVNTYYTNVFGLIPNAGQFISIEIGLYDGILKTYSKSGVRQIQVG